MNYGKRNCLYCHKEFTANYPGHVTCSTECRLKRRHERKELCSYKRNAAASELEWANCRIEELIHGTDDFGNMEWLNCCCESLLSLYRQQLMIISQINHDLDAKDIQLHTLEQDYAEIEKENRELQRKVSDAQNELEAAKCLITALKKPEAPRAKPAAKATAQPKVQLKQSASRNSSVLAANRKCHDCGKPTDNYRCSDCWDKLRREQGISVEAADNSEWEGVE